MGSTASHPSPTGLGWIAIIRLGLVQAAIGAIVMLATSLLNRVMVVEYALAAAVPAGLVAWLGSAWPDLIVAFAIAGLFLHSSWMIIRDARSDLVEAD